MRATEFTNRQQSILEGKHQVQLDDLVLHVYEDGQDVDVRVMDGDRQVGYVIFLRDGKLLIPDDLFIDQEYRGRGVAKKIYDYVKSLGFKIIRSGIQTNMGKRFWDKNRGEHVDVWEEGVAEGKKKFTYTVDVPEGTGNYLGGNVLKFVANNDDEAIEIARKNQGRNLRRQIGYDNSVKVPMTSKEKPLSPWYAGVGSVPANTGPFKKKEQGVAEGKELDQKQVRETLNAWMNKDQQYKDPTSRVKFQTQIWPYIQKNIEIILNDKGDKGNGDYPSAPYAAWLLVQHMDAFPQNQIYFYKRLKRAIPNHPKIQFLRDRAAVNQWIIKHTDDPKYYYKNKPLPNPTVNVRNPKIFKDAGIIATSREEALQNAKEAGNKLLVAAVQATNALTQPSFQQGVAEGLEQSLSSMVRQDQTERNEYATFVKSQAGGDWSKGAKMYAQLKKRPSNDIFGDAVRLNQFMKMKFDFDKFTNEDWDNYWLLAQHCDNNRDFQKNALSIIKKYQGTDHSHYKYLYDRISMGLTGKQKYGTQNVKEQGVAEGSEQQYLWHGSRQKIPMLEPRQSVDTGGAAGSNQNAIYATSDPKVAIAMGLTTPGSDTGMFPNDPQMVLFSGKIRKGENVYLHKLPMNGPDGKPQFVQGGNSREFHSVPGVKGIKPAEIKAVPVDKYLNLIRQATPQDLELRKKYMKQGVAENISEANSNLNSLHNKKTYQQTLQVLQTVYGDEEGQQMLDQYIQAVDQLIHSGGTIYRGVWVTPGTKPRLKDVGQHWTLTAQAAEEYLDSNAGWSAYADFQNDNKGIRPVPYIISAHVGPNSITNNGVFFAEFPEEMEVRLVNPQTAKMKIVKKVEGLVSESRHPVGQLQLQAQESDKQGVAEGQSTCPNCGGPAFTDKILAEKQDACYEVVAEGGAETSWSDDDEKITLQDVLELTKHIKQINLPIDNNLKSKLLHWDGNPEEIERINQVTVSNQFPILVMLDAQGQIGWILDGNHRVHKAIRSQAKTIPAKLIKPSDLSDKAKRIFHIKEQGVAEGKITLSTDPNWYGATVDNYQASGPVVNIPANQLVGFEPDDKMNQPKSKVNVEKIVAGLKQGAKLPPLLVRKYKNGYQVLDGHHRFWAYKLLGVKSIPAQIVPDSDIEEISKQGVAEDWSEKYKRSINCKNPKGFSQRAHCQGRKKNNEQVELDERKRKRKKKTARYYYGPAYYFGATDTGAEGGDGGGLEEDWKKSLANVGLAGAIGLGAVGGLELKDKIKSAFTKPTAQTTQPVQAKSQQVQVSPITNNPLETYLMNVAKKSGLTGIELAQFLGQCAHETMDYKRMIERGAKKYFNKYEPKFAPGKAKLLGNVKLGDGERYKGRGYIQLTGRYNYKTAGKALNLPLEQNPELAAQPDIAAKIALWYWSQRVKPEIQNFADTTSVTRKINPGLSGLEDRHENFLSYIAQRDD